MKKLRIRDKGDYLKVVDPFYETICESFLTKAGCAAKAKVTLNEMVHAWNCSFGKGLDITTMLPAGIVIPNRTVKTFICHGKEFSSLDEVEKYTHSLHLRILLTQTAIDSNIYLVTLTE
jgi:hypothetical protein